jgi:hypothetical protein
VTPPGTAGSREEDAARTWAMVAHLSALGNFFFPFAGLIGAIVIYSARRRDPTIVRENARNAVNAQITLCIFNAVVIAAALVLFGSLFISLAASEPHGGGGATPHFPWQAGAYFGCFVILMLGNVFVAIVACFGARAAYLGRVFRYPFAIPFVRQGSGDGCLGS